MLGLSWESNQVLSSQKMVTFWFEPVLVIEWYRELGAAWNVIDACVVWLRTLHYYAAEDTQEKTEYTLFQMSGK
jgi:hypothetical protein